MEGERACGNEGAREGGRKKGRSVRIESEGDYGIGEDVPEEETMELKDK